MNVIVSLRFTRLAVAMCVAPIAIAAAQTPDASTGGIRGTVKDSTGRALIGVQVVLPGTSLRIETDDDGQFQLARVRPGMLTMRFLRFGYRPDTVTLLVLAGRVVPVTVTLHMMPRQLSPVVVQGRSDLTGWRREFYQRRELGTGHFFTYDDIRKRDPTYLTDIFRQIPGVHIQPSQGVVRNQVRFRGQRCAPLTWVDGAPLSSGEFDLDALVPNSIEAIEVYTGSTAPPRFAVAPGIGPRTCGTIVIWSRQAPPKVPKRAAATVSAAAELAALIEANQIYTAAQVDVTARQDSTRPVRPVYPDALHDAQVSGSVMVEFIVTPMGTVDTERVSVVFSTHPDFAIAVRAALESAAYVPALRGGNPVHQIVQHEFQFVPDSSRRKR